MSSTLSDSFLVNIPTSFLIFSTRQISRAGVDSYNLIVALALSKLVFMQVLEPFLSAHRPANSFPMISRGVRPRRRGSRYQFLLFLPSFHDVGDTIHVLIEDLFF